MHVTADDAARMYARACRAWYGGRALRVAKRTIRQLGQRGDKRGVEAWTKVADQLARIDADAATGPGRPGPC
jgi:hypothetical protein